MKRFLLLILFFFIFLSGLFVISIQTGIPEEFWKTQTYENNGISESESTKILQNTKTTIQTKAMKQKSNTQAQGTLQPPRKVERLCSNQGEQKFVTQDGQQHTFRKSAESIQRCDDGKIWKVTEDGAKTPDPATFYFDGTGVMLDVCQALFWRSGCIRFEHISCEQKNYCEAG